MKSKAIEFIPATLNDRALVKALWKKVIDQAFIEEGLDQYHNPSHELEFKMKQFDAALTQESTHYFLAFKNNFLIGTIAYGSPPNSGILKRTNQALKDKVEIGSLYIDPTLQKHGYGSVLLIFLLEYLLENGVYEVCFDSIIETSKKIWSRMFGEPKYKIRSKKHDFTHMIWLVNVKDSIKRIKNLEYKNQ